MIGSHAPSGNSACFDAWIAVSDFIKDGQAAGILGHDHEDIKRKLDEMY
jgi:hypothetical protein